jgi:tetratricopeptide (TPR) repeat protein
MAPSPVARGTAAAVLLLLLAPLRTAAAQTTPTGPSGTTTTQASCAYPDALKAQGRLADARTEYLAILKKSPFSADCAAAGLATLPSQCATAKALEDHGQAGEAKKAYVELLKQDPASACAGQLKKDSRFSRLLVALPDVSKRFANVVAVAGAGLALLVAGYLLALFLLLQAAKWEPVGRRLRKRVPVVRRILRHRMTFEALDQSTIAERSAKVATPLGMMIQSELLRVSASTMEAPGGETALAPALEGLKELGPEFKVAAAIVALAEKSIRVDRYTIRGSMVSGPRGAGLTLVFERAQARPSGGEVWQLLPDDPSVAIAPGSQDYYALVAQAAGWLTFQFGRRLAPRQWVVANNAESYGLARAGIDYKDRAELPKARRFLERALDLDAENVTALANLALIDAMQGDPLTAVRRLERSKAILEDKLA